MKGIRKEFGEEENIIKIYFMKMFAIKVGNQIPGRGVYIEGSGK